MHAQDAVRDWNLLFSNEALGRVYSPVDRHKRAAGVPCIMSAVSHRGTSSQIRELHMSPSQLIGHLKAIGWAGRVEFVERLSAVHNRHMISQGG